MTELLHALALGPAAIGACCLVADRRRVRAPELTASALMLLSMIDATLIHAVAPVFWAAFLIVGAMVLAAVRRQRGPAGPSIRSVAAMTVHTAIGMVAMAALLLAMGHTDADTSRHSHGMDGATLAAALFAGVIAYAAGSLIAARRAHEWKERTQYLAMGASTLIMGVALIA